MAQRGKHRLTDKEVRNAKTPGRLHDGQGLYLSVSARKSADGETRLRRSWLLLFTSPLGGRREMGLGSLDKVDLAAARKAADAAYKLLGAGVDPLDQREEDAKAAALAKARALTFKQAAGRYIEAHQPGWKNPKHGKLWASSLEAYAYPELGELPVAKISVEDVMRTLERDQLWTTKPETAARVRGRIEAVLDWCAVRGFRDRNTINPASWRGNLEKALPPRSKVRKVKHHAALPYQQVGAFMAELRKQEGLGALALQLAILTAARTGETLGARWAEFDLTAKVWVIPQERMKAGEQHRVPLSPQALAVLEMLKAHSSGKGWVFPGLGTKKHLSGMAMLKTLERMKRRGAVTTHGFRSSFRDWCAEQTQFPREVCEAALAHKTADKVEAAYMRSDLFERRRKLMDAWGAYCDRPAAESADVVPMTAAKRKRAGHGGRA